MEAEKIAKDFKEGKVFESARKSAHDNAGACAEGNFILKKKNVISVPEPEEREPQDEYVVSGPEPVERAPGDQRLKDDIVRAELSESSRGHNGQHEQRRENGLLPEIRDDRSVHALMEVRSRSSEVKSERNKENK